MSSKITTEELGRISNKGKYVCAIPWMGLLLLAVGHVCSQARACGMPRTGGRNMQGEEESVSSKARVFYNKLSGLLVQTVQLNNFLP